MEDLRRQLSRSGLPAVAGPASPANCLANMHRARALTFAENHAALWHHQRRLGGVGVAAGADVIARAVVEVRAAAGAADARVVTVRVA